MVFNLHRFIYHLPVVNPMPTKPVDILHAAMTNHFVILAVAILLFLLVIILVDPISSGSGEMWS